MANLLARRACQSLLRTRLASPLTPPLVVVQQQHCSIHATTAVQKKKAKGAAGSPSSPTSVFEDDLFGNPEDDLFAHLASTPSPKPTSTPAPPPTGKPTSQPTSTAPTTPTPTPTKSKPKKAKLPPAERHRRFTAYLTYIAPQLGRTPAVPNPRVKKRSLVTLLQLAQSEEELGKVMELLPRWRESGREVLPGFGEAFVRRTHELACPSLALTLFGHYAKYQVPLTLPAAHWLLHSLTLRAPTQTHTPAPAPAPAPAPTNTNTPAPTPLEQIMVATALYPIYHLPPISADLPSAALVAAACYAHGSERSVRLAEELRPSVERLLRAQKELRERLEEERSSKTKKTRNSKPSADADPAALSSKPTTTTPTPNKAQTRAARKTLQWTAHALRTLNKAAQKRTGRVYVPPELIPDRAGKGLRLGVVCELLGASTGGAGGPGTGISGSAPDSSASAPSEAAVGTEAVKDDAHV